LNAGDDDDGRAGAQVNYVQLATPKLQLPRADLKVGPYGACAMRIANHSSAIINS
jgi:hypothetical protein